MHVCQYANSREVSIACDLSLLSHDILTLVNHRIAKKWTLPFMVVGSRISAVMERYLLSFTAGAARS